MPDLKWHYDWFVAFVIAFRHGLCYLPERVQIVRSSSDSFAQAGMRDPEAYRQLVLSLLQRLESSALADVRSYFKIPAVLSRFGFKILDLVSRNPEFWHYLSPGLIECALKAEGFQMQVGMDPSFSPSAETLSEMCRQLLVDCAANLKQQGDKLATAKQPHKAAEAYRRALEAAVDFAPAHASLGALLHREGRLAQASLHYRAALKIQPNFRAVRKALDLIEQSAPLATECGSCAPSVGSPAGSAGAQQTTDAPPQRGPSTRRLLAVYDLAAQPYSIGDLILFQEASLVRSWQEGTSAVDICFLIDSTRPPTEPMFEKLINEENRCHHLFSILPITQINPKLGSIFILDSWDRFVAFCLENAAFYSLYPGVEELHRREYLNYKIFDMLAAHYRRQGFCPQITSRSSLLAWAQSFYDRWAWPLVPVTVNLRNNAKLNPARNSDLHVWQHFFSYCEGRFPAKFVVICGHAEFMNCFDEFPNVTLAKAHHTSVEEDIALVQTSALHLGTMSGTATMRLFSPGPYFLLNENVDASLFDGVMVDEGRTRRWAFSRAGQLCAKGPEDLQQLIGIFEKLWTMLDTERWRSPRNERRSLATEQLTWLR